MTFQTVVFSTMKALLAEELTRLASPPGRREAKNPGAWPAQIARTDRGECRR